MKQKHIRQEISQSNFFGEHTKQLKEMILSSRVEQQRLRKMKSIEKIKRKGEEVNSNNAEKVLDNIVVDYLKSLNLNYTYSVLMRERDLISDEITSKLKLVEFLHLQDIYNSTSRLDISVLQMMLIQQSNQIGKVKQTLQAGIQVDLVGKNNVVNHQLLNEIRISEARKQVEANEKRHYQILLQNMKEQINVTLKDQLKKQFELKMKNLKNQYQQQVSLLKQKNKEFLVNSPKLNPKIQEYLTKIEKLQSSNNTLNEKIKVLQKEKITHNCSKNEKIVQIQSELKKERKALQYKKNEYQLALRCLQTSLEDLAQKKHKLNQEPKLTDLFVNDIKKNKASKDHMIEEIYGRLFIMDKRVENLSKDNQSLMEQNRQLLAKIKQLQVKKQDLTEKYQQTFKKQEQLRKNTVKIKTKDVIIGVTQQQIRQSQYQNKKEHVIDQSISEIASEEEDVNLDNKRKYRMEINTIYSQMRTLKNKLRLTVQSFQ